MSKIFRRGGGDGIGESDQEKNEEDPVEGDGKATFSSKVSEKLGRIKKQKRVGVADLELTDMSGPEPSSPNCGPTNCFAYQESVDQVEKKISIKIKKASKEKVGNLKLKTLKSASTTPDSPDVVIEIEANEGALVIPEPKAVNTMKTNSGNSAKKTEESAGVEIASSQKPRDEPMAAGSTIMKKANSDPSLVMSYPKENLVNSNNNNAGTCDKATQVGEDEDDGNEEESEQEKDAPPKRRHSTGNITASYVNHAHLMAKFRRLQRRRFRPPKMSITVKCLLYFMGFLYYIGMSPFKPSSAKKLPKWFVWLQTIFYWLFAIISLVDSLFNVKDRWIQFLVDDNMLTFITFGFFLANVLTRIYNIILFATSKNSTSDLMEKIDRVNTRCTRKNNNGWSLAIAGVVASLSILLTGAGTVFGDVEFYKWSFRDLILDRSFEFSEYLFIWTSTDYEAASIQLAREYGLNVTVTVKWFAAAGNVLAFCGTLHGCVILDLWPIITLQIILLQYHFSAAMKRTKKFNKTGRCPLSIHWRHYMELRDVCDDNHKVFGKLLKFIHIGNVLLFGYFLLQLLDKTALNAEFLINTFSVLKVSLTYYLVQKSADDNEEYEDCVVKCSRHSLTIEMDGVTKSVSVLLQDMKKHPIGVGRGDFFVNEAFIIKFMCTVGSIFLLLSGKSDDSCSCKTP